LKKDCRGSAGDQRAAGETRVLGYFQERMPYRLFVPDIPWRTFDRYGVAV